MKNIKKVIIVLVSVILLLVVASYFLPGHAVVVRSAKISAPVELVYAQVSDFNNWNKWSPWYEKDPSIKQIITGNAGMGKHLMKWESQKDDVGHGSVEFDKVIENKSIDATLTFDDMGMSSIMMYRFEPTPSGSNVVWSDSATLGYNPMMRWMGLFMDKFMGPDFEAGLKNLKEVSEKK